MEKMSFKQALLESLQSNPKRFQKKVRVNKPLKVSDIDTHKLLDYYEDYLDDYKGMEIAKEIVKLEKLDIKWWYIGDHSQEYKMTFDGCTGTLAPANFDIPYRLMHNGETFWLEAPHESPRIFSEEEIGEYIIKYPELFKKNGIDIEDYLKK